MPAGGFCLLRPGRSLELVQDRVALIGAGAGLLRSGKRNGVLARANDCPVEQTQFGIEDQVG